MLTTVAGAAVIGFGLFLIGVAAATFVKPNLVERFLRAFASTPRAHVTEQAIRLVFGAALILRAPLMWQPDAFRILGWVVIATSVGLLLLPWRWHHWFAGKVIPTVIRLMKLYAVLLVAFAVFLVYGVLAGIQAG